MIELNEKDRSPSPDFSPFASTNEGLTALPKYKAAGDTALDFGGLLDDPVKVHEDLASGCGGQLWPAGMVLAKHMLRYHRDKLQHARILELGAGGGIVSLAVAKGCRLNSPLYMTDQPEMELLMKHNITLNGLEGKVLPKILSWGEALSADIVDFKPDTILAADCVYFEPAFPLLTQTLKDLLALCPTTTVYFCFMKRRRADMQFIRAAKKVFQVTEMVDEDRPVFSRQAHARYTLFLTWLLASYLYF
ncbi:putative methyltransferase-domain-containing protein [Lasiosphaeria hispida]|uniref:Protein-lysine N-methyltransferase EFM6 n=1 Tax=Lasiosphaeria hispida TaxID=260671 RepID=A0AAJ0HRP7_9PEZI|nr:putative methyltransferase-domain-containing protein [Lasiosphaeria hispida]